LGAPSPDTRARATRNLNLTAGLAANTQPRAFTHKRYRPRCSQTARCLFELYIAGRPRGASRPTWRSCRSYSRGSNQFDEITDEPNVRPQHAWFATLCVLAADSPRVLRSLVSCAKPSTRAACIRHSSFVPFTFPFSFFVGPTKPDRICSLLDIATSCQSAAPFRIKQFYRKCRSCRARWGWLPGGGFRISGLTPNSQTRKRTTRF
jgi:hypothetical protein